MSEVATFDVIAGSNTRQSAPLTVAIASGKGGVGKTMLAVALAREVSRSTRTLLVDLDFFNRGLTGLLQSGTKVQTICKPDFLASPQSPEEETWDILEVAPNLFHISYPDLTEDDMRKFESSDVEELRRSLHAFIVAAAEICKCAFVVMDCHGGPDNSSFAACLFADHTLLISEPDRITFYGTLNFIRQLRRTVDRQPSDVRLVFNKVVPAFSATFLNSFYKKHLRAEFQGKRLLAVFPLEVYLTKEFEKTPFLTSVYPTSLLARKTQVLLFELLSPKKRTLLPASVRSLPKWTRKYRELTLGKQFFLVNLNLLMLLIAVGTVVAILLSTTLERDYGTWAQDHFPKLQPYAVTLLDYLKRGGLLMAAWFPVTLLIAWSKSLDIKFIYSVRMRQHLKAAGIYLAGLLLWLPVIFLLAGLSNDVLKKGVVGETTVTLFLCIVFGSVILEEAVRVYRGFRYDRHPFENVFRLIFLIYISAGPFVLLPYL
jgi:MinD-like ATPase involved in chromosome partitioning or flagellar assembly